jgi:hypothetical protein
VLGRTYDEWKAREVDAGEDEGGGAEEPEPFPEAAAELLRGLGYAVLPNPAGRVVAAPSYWPLTFMDARQELGVVELLGEEAVRALDAVARLGRPEEAEAERRRLLREAGGPGALRAAVARLFAGA